MSTKKPTEKQLAARKKFAAMAKSGELAKTRKTTTKKKTAVKNVKYLGYEIKKTADTKGNKMFETITAVPLKKTLTEAKKDIISHLVKGKVSVLKIASIKNKVAKIKTLKDLNKEIKTANTGLNAPAKSIEFKNSNVLFNGIGRDINGNKVVKLGFVNKKGFSIQTLGNLPFSHKLNSKETISQSQLNKIEKEVVAYIKEHGSATQKKYLKTYTGLNAPVKRQSAKSLCRKVVRVEGLKVNGQLKKGYKYEKGKVVKSAPKKKVVKK